VNEQRLGQAGHSDDEAVAAGEQREQHELDHVFLTDDELLQLGDDLIVSNLQPIGEGDIVMRLQRGSGDCRGQEMIRLKSD